MKMMESTKAKRAETFRKHLYERAENEIGNTYNYLTVSSVNYDETEKYYAMGKRYGAFCNFDCKCGKQGLTHRLSSVKNGHIKSCGCIRFNNPKNIKDLTGKKFGRLTVLGRDLKRDLQEQKGTVHWLCQCDCGNPKLSSVTGYQLESGHTQSCGCYASEQIAKRNKKYSTKINKYITDGKVTYLFDEKNNRCTIDTEDLDIVLQWYWRKEPKRGDIDKGYWTTNSKIDDGYNKTILGLHQIIGEIKFGEYDRSKFMPDHLSRDTDDNRKCNLYLKDNIENCRNRSLSKANTSGKTGVSFDQSKNLWVAYITVNYKRVHLGFFEKYEDAVEARIAAEIKYGFTCDDKVSDYDYGT